MMKEKEDNVLDIFFSDTMLVCDFHVFRWRVEMV